MIESSIQNTTATLILKGTFDKFIAKDDILSLQNIAQNPAIQSIVLNLNDITKFDSTFLIFLYRYRKNLSKDLRKLTLIANSDKAKRILELLQEIEIKDSTIKRVKKEDFFYQKQQRDWNASLWLVGDIFGFFEFYGDFDLFCIFVPYESTQDSLCRNQLSHF